MSDDELGRLAARADLCRLLAACYYEPGPEFVEERAFESLAAAAGAIDRGLANLADAMSRQFSCEPLERLRLDYTALFLHPTLPRALPYESCWIGSEDPMARQQVIDAVVRFYRDHGFSVADEFRDLPDHIAAELEFLYTVLFREASACHAGRTQDRAAAAAAGRSFVRDHLDNWIGRFSQAVRDGAETPYYRSLAELTARFVALERA